MSSQLLSIPKLNVQQEKQDAENSETTFASALADATALVGDGAAKAASGPRPANLSTPTTAQQ